jgi:hypothetical protein
MRDHRDKPIMMLLRQLELAVRLVKLFDFLAQLRRRAIHLFLQASVEIASDSMGGFELTDARCQFVLQPPPFKGASEGDP